MCLAIKPQSVFGAISRPAGVLRPDAASCFAASLATEITQSTASLETDLTPPPLDKMFWIRARLIFLLISALQVDVNGAVFGFIPVFRHSFQPETERLILPDR